MGIWDRLKLGGISLQVARYAAQLAMKIGAEAVEAVIAEVARLERQERNLTGRQKFDRLADYLLKHLADAAREIDLVSLLVEWLVKWFKATGLFRSRVNGSATSEGPR
jgi:hypothetical protein